MIQCSHREQQKGEIEMLSNVINTVLDYVWYEIYERREGEHAFYDAFRIDGEFGMMRTVAKSELKQSDAEREVKFDMARLGIA